MKQSAFIVFLFVIAFIVSVAIFELVLGNPANFSDAARGKPIGYMGQIYTGGPLVALLITLSIMDVAIIIERSLSLKKAAGKKAIPKFFKGVIDQIRADKLTRQLHRAMRSEVR